jgi:hypothetical protein
MSLTPPLPIRAERSRLSVAALLEAGIKNRGPECQIYLPSENKFLCVVVDVQTGLHGVRLLEGDRFFPSKNVAMWRVLPADRTSKDKRLLLQNVFSNMYLGHDQRGMAQCNQTLPTPYEHLNMQVRTMTTTTTTELGHTCQHKEIFQSRSHVAARFSNRNYTFDDDCPCAVCVFVIHRFRWTKKRACFGLCCRTGTGSGARRSW